jgi:hypothetical protein
MMNVRLVFLILVIVFFALGTGFMSYSQTTGVSFKQAYDAKTVVATQVTNPGTVPHQVSIKNTGNDAVKMVVGDVLTANSSQDLVIAENKTILANSTDNVNAYGLVPGQKSIPGVKFKPGGTSSTAIKEIIYSSNPNDLLNATATQVQIWIITSGIDFSIYTGEPVALVEQQNMSYTQLRQVVSDAKTSISTRFNVKTEEIKNLNENGTSNSGNIMDNFLTWLKSTTGI